jgi:hypothetical protein
MAGLMPDICDLILDDHETQRRRFAELDGQRDSPPETLADRWKPLADLLELHAAAEEAVFYPALLDRGVKAKDETEDAITDHNQIRDAVKRAADADAGSDTWWEAVGAARESNSDHMAEEERGALADLRAHDSEDERLRRGDRWLAFCTEHAGMRGLRPEDKDPDAYIEEHS